MTDEDLSDEWWRRQMAHILAHADVNDTDEETLAWAREELAALDALPGQARTPPLVDDNNTTAPGGEFPVDVASFEDALRAMRKLVTFQDRRRYGKRYRQFRAPRWRPPQRRFTQRDVALPELADLVPPILLAGEPVPPPVISYLPARPIWWYPDGRPVLTTDREAIDTYLLATVEPGVVTRIARTSLFRGGVSIWIATDFLAVDMGHTRGTDAPPMLWETLISHDGRAREGWRYASRAAALAGHRQIVAALYAARPARTVRRRLAAVPPLAVNARHRPSAWGGKRRGPVGVHVWRWS